MESDQKGSRLKSKRDKAKHLITIEVKKELNLGMERKELKDKHLSRNTMNQMLMKLDRKGNKESS